MSRPRHIAALCWFVLLSVLTLGCSSQKGTNSRSVGAAPPGSEPSPAAGSSETPPADESRATVVVIPSDEFAGVVEPQSVAATNLVNSASEIIITQLELGTGAPTKVRSVLPDNGRGKVELAEGVYKIEWTTPPRQSIAIVRPTDAKNSRTIVSVVDRKAGPEAVALVGEILKQPQTARVFANNALSAPSILHLADSSRYLSKSLLDAPDWRAKLAEIFVDESAKALDATTDDPSKLGAQLDIAKVEALLSNKAYEPSAAFPDGPVTDLVKRIIAAAAADPASIPTLAALPAAAEAAKAVAKLAGTISPEDREKLGETIAADQTAPAPGAILATTGLGMTEFTLRWTIGTDNQTAAEDLRYFVCSGSTADAVRTIEGCESASVEQDFAANLTSLTVAGRTPATTYFFNIVVADLAGNKGVFSGISVTTAAAATNTPETVATPTATPAAGSYAGTLSVLLSTATPGATIHFTTDGSEPTTASAVFSTALPVTVSTTVKALAAKAGLNNSSILTSSYTLEAAIPGFSVAAGTYATTQTVTLTTTTAGAAIHYTIDGSTPTLASPVFSSPLTVASSRTIKAFASKAGWNASPVAVARYEIGAIVTQIALSEPVGSASACAVVNSGIKCWGDNSNGQLGHSNLDTWFSTPAQTIPAGSGATFVAMAPSVGSSAKVTCAVVDGGVLCWGQNNTFQLGDGTQADRNEPITAIPPGSGATSLATNENGVCAVVDGGLQCWGADYDGTLSVLGSGTTNPYLTTPTQIFPPGSGVTQVVMSSRNPGSPFSCVVIDGGVKCWGYNNAGQLGDGSANISSSNPVTAIASGSGVTAVVLGASSACALVGGGLDCWGNYDASTVYAPTLKYGPSSVITQASIDPAPTAFNYGCAVVRGGVECWDHTGHRGTFIPHNSGATWVSVNNGNVCAVVAGGLKCWTASDDTVGEILASNSGVSRVTSGRLETCMIKDDTDVYCFGADTNGVSGRGSLSSEPHPTDNVPKKVTNLSLDPACLGSILCDSLRKPPSESGAPSSTNYLHAPDYGSLSTRWQGIWNFASGRAVRAFAGAAEGALIDVGTSAYTASVDVHVGLVGQTDSYTSLLLRATDRNNAWVVKVENDRPRMVSIFAIQGGSEGAPDAAVTLTPAQMANNSTHQLKASVTGSTIKVYWDGAEIARTDTAFFNQTATMFGLVLYNSTNGQSAENLLVTPP